MTSLTGGTPLVTSGWVLYVFGQNNTAVMNGAYWQLLTSMFVHVNIVHLLGNMFFLLIFGLRAEEVFSKTEYLLVYLASGLCGNLLTLLIPDLVSAGASGAIFGVFGAVTIYLRKSVGQSIVSALVFAAFLFLINIGPETNLLAHFGGLIAGLVIGYVLALEHGKRTKSPYRYSYTYRT